MSKAPTEPKTARRACVVTIGYMRLLVPAEDGLKLVSLLQRAVEAKHIYGRDQVYIQAGETPTIELEICKPEQLRPPPTGDRRDAMRNDTGLPDSTVGQVLRLGHVRATP